MTTVETAAPRGETKLRLRSAFAGLTLIAALGLAGCETGSSLLGSSGPGNTALNEPPPAAAPAQAAPQSSQTRVAIAPVIGAPDAIAKQLQQQLSSAAAQKRITVATAPGDKADYTLRGYVVSAAEKTGTKVSYIWDVTDPAGKRVNRITGEEIVAGAAGAAGKDPWASVTPQTLQSIADKTAVSLASWLPTQGAGAAVASSGGATSGAPVQTAAATGAMPSATKANAGGPTTGSIANQGPVAAVVPSVTGAPGDGASSLTGALQKELTKNGVALTSTPGTGVYRVEGKVAVGEAKDGKQPIQIDWMVKDASGKKVGTVSQKNEIPQGSLDGAWGKTADNAAAAAAQGILKLLPQQGKTSTN